jgi:membrane protein required for colicin V production
MNGLDIALIGLLGIPAFMGFRSGLIRMVANLAGIFIGITLVGQFGGDVSNQLASFIDNETVAKILGFVIIVAVTLTIATFIGNLVKKALTFVFLGWLDKVAGTALGLLVGAMFASVTIFILDSGPFETTNRLVAESGFAGFFIDIILPLANLLPGNLETLAEVL